MSEILIKKQAVKDWDELKKRVDPLIKEIAGIAQEYLNFQDIHSMNSNNNHKGMLMDRMKTLFKNEVRDYGKKEGEIEQSIDQSPFHMASAEKMFQMMQDEIKQDIKDIEKRNVERLKKKRSEVVAIEISYKKKKPTFFQKVFGINPGMEMKMGDSNVRELSFDGECICGKCDE